MAIEVAKVELKTVQDASGLEQKIAERAFTADQVIAVVGKTEGNGGVNDFTRILADQAFRRVLIKRGKRSEAEIHNVPMVWSGGCDGVITPHATIFARNAKTGPAELIAARAGAGDPNALADAAPLPAKPVRLRGKRQTVKTRISSPRGRRRHDGRHGRVPAPGLRRAYVQPAGRGARPDERAAGRARSLRLRHRASPGRRPRARAG